VIHQNATHFHWTSPMAQADSDSLPHLRYHILRIYKKHIESIKKKMISPENSPSLVFKGKNMTLERNQGISGSPIPISTSNIGKWFSFPCAQNASSRFCLLCSHHFNHSTTWHLLLNGMHLAGFMD
jgi:hypothetical protein